MSNKLYTIKTNSVGTLIEKNSKFVAQVFKISSETEAKEIIKNIKKENKKANHNVYAYTVMGNEQIISRYNDDKEPHGTAGRPILFLLNGFDLCNVLVIVTRYFGGTLLGKGGLIRSYTKSVKIALDNTEIIEIEGTI